MSTALEPAGLLVAADGLPCPRPALAARELARPVLAVGLGGGQMRDEALAIAEEKPGADGGSLPEGST